MGGLFSKSKNDSRRSAPELSVKDKATLELKVSRDRLEKARAKYDLQKNVYVEKARELLKAKNKPQAKLALQMKKMHEVQLNKIQAQLLNVQQLVSDVEWAGYQREIVEGMKAGNLALKELTLDVEEVEAVMGETQEAMDKAREVDSIIAETLNPEDEASVLAELEAIEKEEMDTLSAQLPTAPTEPIHTPSTDPVQANQVSAEIAAGEETVGREAVLA
mmetsp:Transcript_15371/g.27333  ORF Transcript_15371/g.27333 Transcript_15371/m.27333 type:complete len:219 (+) Transcript_15371:63-719(+)